MLEPAQVDHAGLSDDARPGRDQAIRGKFRPTMEDVARLAGTSAQTVSRVLRRHPGVSEGLRLEVMAAIDKVGYRKTSIARALTTGRTMSIGVLHFDANSFYSRSAISYGAQRAALARGYSTTVVGTTSLSSAAVTQGIHHLREQGVDGLIVTIPVSDIPALSQATAGLPTVLINGPKTESYEVLGIDQVEIGRQATQYLLDLGHTTVWHVGGPKSWSDAKLRVVGWTDALDGAVRAVPPLLIGDWTAESGYRNGEILGRLPEVTAVFVASDEMAFGVIRALKDLGRRVPEDVSVVSVDDIALARYCDPPLTTIRQPFEELGEQAAHDVITLIDDPHSARGWVGVDAELIVRNSAGAPPK